jgi:mRNA interferase RelE/StbE
LTWKIKWEDFAVKQLRKLDKQIEKRVISYLKKVALENPRQQGKPLSGDKPRLWRYRMGEYRIICRIMDDELIVLVIAVGHRKEIYN